MKPVTLGLIIGNRGFFPDHLCVTGRKTILKVLADEGINVVVLDDTVNKAGGSIITNTEAQMCADLFKQRRDDIDGVLITLPNFGEERPIANTLRWSGLDVPVLVHAFPDDATKMTILDRRDSFCGKMSTCNNLTQYGIKFSLTALHTVDPESASFKADLRKFAAVCRVYDLSHTDGCKIAIPLIGEHYKVGAGTLDARSHRRCAAVSSTRPRRPMPPACERWSSVPPPEPPTKKCAQKPRGSRRSRVRASSPCSHPRGLPY